MRGLRLAEDEDTLTEVCETMHTLYVRAGWARRADYFPQAHPYRDNELVPDESPQISLASLEATELHVIVARKSILIC